MDAEYKKKEFVRAFDPDFYESGKEHIFAWNNDTPMIRPNMLVCPSCNHALPEPKKNGRPNCSHMKCDNCGNIVKLYGYDNLYYDKTTDDDDYNIDDVYDMNIEQPEDAIYRGIMRKSSKEKYSSDDNVEHMDAYHKTNVTIGGVVLFIFLLIITYLIANYRGELQYSKEYPNHTNWVMVIGILFFMPFYWAYVLVDVIARPCRNCIVP